MKILGVNSGRAAPARVDPTFARPLADGAAALLVDGRIACAAIEERHSRIRYSGGFSLAAPAVLADCGIAPEAVDAIGISSCCDVHWTTPDDRLELLVEGLSHQWPADRLRRAWKQRVHLVDHHDSHAALAFVGSGRQRALVCVMDGFGNRRDQTDEFHVGPDWWQGAFDRQTFFLAEWHEGRIRLERIKESGNGAHDVGLAELYRAVTHFCGWKSYQYAGKTMALAGYGDRTNLENLALAQATSDGGIEVLVENLHDDPIAQINAALQNAGYTPPTDLRRPATSESAFLADLAAMLQHQLETTLTAVVSTLSDMYEVRDVAFAGGLAMNCIALGRLARTRPDLSLYVPPAPGDTGQGLGNALWLAYAENSPVQESVRPLPIGSAAMGPAYGAARYREAARTFVEAYSDFRLEADLEDHELAAKIAAALLAGKTVGVRRGRAELGPRALGQCSILADPRQAKVQIKVNAIKMRENFRPFAASVLAEQADTCFPGGTESPFMSFAGHASDWVRQNTPGIVHIDGTTRYQTVRQDGSLLRLVLEQTYSRAGLPLVLNSSFNLAGEPMVETPEEALDVFKRSKLDAVAIGDQWITRI